MIGLHDQPLVGALTAIAGSPFSVAPSQITTLAADPDANGGTVPVCGRCCLWRFHCLHDRPNHGALTAVSGSPFLSLAAASSLAVDGTGKYLYASEGTSTGVSVRISHRSDPERSHPLPEAHFSIGATTIDVDQTGTFLLAVAGGSGQIDVVPIQRVPAFCCGLELGQFVSDGHSSRRSVVPSQPAVSCTRLAEGSAWKVSVHRRILTGAYGSPFTDFRILDRIASSTRMAPRYFGSNIRRAVWWASNRRPTNRRM